MAGVFGGEDVPCHVFLALLGLCHLFYSTTVKRDPGVSLLLISP